MDSLECACPPLLVDGPDCASCLATVMGDSTDAGEILNAFSACQSAIPTDYPCQSLCSGVVSAAQSCEGGQCLCPVVEASASACGSCLAVSSDPYLAPAMTELLDLCGNSATVAIPASTFFSPQITLTPATRSSAPTQSSVRVSFVATTSIASKSAASGLQTASTGRSIQLFMIFCLVFGLFGVLI